MRRLMLFVALFTLMGSKWDGRPIVARTLESTPYSSSDAILVVEVVDGVLPEDLLGRTMFYDQPGADVHSEARIFLAQPSGLNIRIHVSVRVGSAPRVGTGAVIL